MAIGRRVRRRHDETAPRLSNDPKTRFVIAEVTLKDGSHLTREFKGLPGLSDPTEKFRDATGNHPAVSAVPDLVRTMRGEDDLHRLVQLLSNSLN